MQSKTKQNGHWRSFLQPFSSGLHNFQHEFAQENESFKVDIVKRYYKDLQCPKQLTNWTLKTPNGDRKTKQFERDTLQEIHPLGSGVGCTCCKSITSCKLFWQKLNSYNLSKNKNLNNVLQRVKNRTKSSLWQYFDQQ